MSAGEAPREPDLADKPSPAFAALDGGANASALDRIEREPYRFDFFQLARLLEWAALTKREAGEDAAPAAPRFNATVSLAFPASSVSRVVTRSDDAAPAITVNFMGLVGPSGVLPTFYTELLFDLARDAEREGDALRAWLDAVHHRVVSLFYAAWTKYRFAIAFERGEPFADRPDPFTQGLFSLIGLGLPMLRRRLKVFAATEALDAEPIAEIEDHRLLRYAGMLAQRRCSIAALEAFLSDYFGRPIRVTPFAGQWLDLEVDTQSRLGDEGPNHRLGVNAVIGERVWDVESKFRVHVGPLSWDEFIDWLPDPAPTRDRKKFFLLTRLARLAVGIDLDFDVQLVVRATEIRECQLREGDGVGARLGWNAWLKSESFLTDAGDATFPVSLWPQ